MTTFLKEHIPCRNVGRRIENESDRKFNKCTKDEGVSVAREINCILFSFSFSFRGRIDSHFTSVGWPIYVCAVCVWESNCVACPKRPSVSNHGQRTKHLPYTQFIRIQSNSQMGKVCSFSHRTWFQDNIFIGASVRKHLYIYELDLSWFSSFLVKQKLSRTLM